MVTRRDLLVGSVVAAAAGPVLAQHEHHSMPPPPTTPTTTTPPKTPWAPPAGTFGKVITPNGATLPVVDKGGVKVMHLVASEVDHEFCDGLRVTAWGYNGRTSGPTIEVTEGDKVRIYVTNQLPEPTTVHWHGLRLENGMDGVAGLTQKPIRTGETFKYEFTCRDPGTYMYHPHFDEMTQMALGMMGFFIVHPKRIPHPSTTTSP